MPSCGLGADTSDACKEAALPVARHLRLFVQDMRSEQAIDRVIEGELGGLREGTFAALRCSTLTRGPSSLHTVIGNRGCFPKPAFGTWALPTALCIFQSSTETQMGLPPGASCSARVLSVVMLVCVLVRALPHIFSSAAQQLGELWSVG
ncbi:hypothetical protein mRhiFer1_009210 [Rhinolophus ferrumequinum]|uniref:Uncharacterized protein n=1 Tax=Rhinolophus ferrumequinum TaxID=59479 RepID=A0A7J7SJ64_RHIFE|nr:hypothetical protein mRhiFer1_009210 [Rhinolophus ferrumequinum]